MSLLSKVLAKEQVTKERAFTSRSLSQETHRSEKTGNMFYLCFIGLSGQSLEKIESSFDALVLTSNLYRK